jgi:hypothetical protein
MARHYESKAGGKKGEEKRTGAFSLPGDNSAVAMMPQNVIYRSVEAPYHSLPAVYESDIEGVDSQIRDDNRQMMKGFKPTKV